MKWIDMQGTTRASLNTSSVSSLGLRGEGSTEALGNSGIGNSASPKKDHRRVESSWVPPQSSRSTFPARASSPTYTNRDRMDVHEVGSRRKAQQKTGTRASTDESNNHTNHATKPVVNPSKTCNKRAEQTSHASSDMCRFPLHADLEEDVREPPQKELENEGEVKEVDFVSALQEKRKLLSGLYDRLREMDKTPRANLCFDPERKDLNASRSCSSLNANRSPRGRERENIRQPAQGDLMASKSSCSSMGNHSDPSHRMHNGERTRRPLLGDLKASMSSDSLTRNIPTSKSSDLLTRNIPNRSLRRHEAEHARRRSTLKLAIFDFDCTLTCFHVFASLAGLESSKSILPVAPPHARTERGQLCRLRVLDGDREWGLGVFALEAFGGESRLSRLRCILKMFRECDVECVILSRGMVGPIRKCLEQVTLLHFFARIFGNIGSASGVTAYDCKIPSCAHEEERFMGEASTDIGGKHVFKAEHIKSIMEERRLNAEQVVFMDDDFDEIRQALANCRCIHVASGNGAQEREFQLLQRVLNQNDSHDITSAEPGLHVDTQSSYSREAVSKACGYMHMTPTLQCWNIQTPTLQCRNFQTHCRSSMTGLASNILIPDARCS